MAIRRITSARLAEPANGAFSNCLVVGDQIFVAGMTASGGPQGGPIGGSDPYQQSCAAIEKCQWMLEAAGASLKDVVKMTIYLTDIGHRAAFGRAREAYFQEPRPCSTLIEVKGLAQPGMLVEVDVTAIRGASASSV